MKSNPVLSPGQRMAYAGKICDIHPPELRKPLSVKKPSRIGVQFMGDLLHEKIQSAWISEIFNVMKACPQHTFFILTKRPKNLLYFITGLPVADNIWFGVSVENQETADKRIPVLLDCPVKNRWISAEPLLGEIDLREYPNIRCGCGDCWTKEGGWPCPAPAPRLDWVVCGAETGPKARLMHWEWAISLANQCKAAKVPFFLKEPWESCGMFRIPHECRRREMPDICNCESCRECRAKGF